MPAPRARTGDGGHTPADSTHAPCGAWRVKSTAPPAEVLDHGHTAERRPSGFRPGLRTWLIAMVVLIVGVTELASYWNAAGVLRAAMHEREVDKAATVGRIVEGLLDTHVSQLQSLAALLRTHPTIVDAVDAQAPQSNLAFVRAVEQLRTSLKLDVLEFTDNEQIVVYRAQAPARRGDRTTARHVAEALTGSSVLTTITTERSPGHNAMIQTVAPLERAGAAVGSVILGMQVNDAFIARVAKEVGAALTLIADDGRLVATSADPAPPIEAEAIEAAFTQKAPYSRRSSELQATVLYVPIRLVDEAFVMQVVVDSKRADRVFEAGAKHSAIAGVMIATVAVILAVVLLRFALAPLRRLRRKTTRLVLQTTGQQVEIANEGDAIGSTVQALDAMTDHLVQKNQELASARDAALAASDAKSAFLSSMSHEIRTPLNGVLGMADLLHRTALSTDQRKYCDAIRGSGRQLHSLLSDVLDLAKIEAGKLSLEAIDFDLHALLADVGTTYRELAAERGTSFALAPSPELPGRLNGDPTRLRQILSNVLGNSIKFTQGGRIDCKVTATAGDSRQAGIRLRVEIRDTGIGIAADKLQSLFQPFNQADTSTTRTHGGTGLGLAICKRIVELMGGTIELESAAGQGTTVRLDLPCAKASTAAPDPRASSLTRPCGQLCGHVLVAEDNPVNQIVVTEMLAGLGLTCTIADNGQKAIEASEQHRFDLILMDCQMPVLDGYVATARIRALERDAKRTPIIALTANAFAEDRQRCLDAGMDDYLTKPVSMNALEATISRWLGGTVGAPASAPAPSLSPTPSIAPVLDRQVLAHLTEQISAPATRKIVRTYLDTASALKAKLQEATTRTDLESFRTTVHALKSSSRFVGALVLAELAAEAETFARRGDTTQAWSTGGPLEQALDEACRALAAYLAADEAAA